MHPKKKVSPSSEFLEAFAYHVGTTYSLIASKNAATRPLRSL